MKKKIVTIVLVMGILWITRLCFCIYRYNYKYEYFKNKKIEVLILNIYKISEEGVTYEIKYNRDKFLLYIKDINTIYNFGEKLEIIASNYEIETKGNPYEFNYKRYLNSKGFVSRIYCSKVIKTTTQKGILYPIYYVRNFISEKLIENMDYDNANILKSLIYGDDLFLKDEIKELFSDIWIGHYLCVSGTHAIFLLEMYEAITRNKNSKIGKRILLIYFYLISFFNVSLLRAIIMNVLSMCKKFNSFSKRYIFTLYLISLVNPYYIFNIGVIFSFLSIIGIHIFNSSISSYLKLMLKTKLLYKICDSISLTISSQILILPFEISYFGKLSIICIFSNLILSGILNLLMISGFSLFILFFIPILSRILINSCNILVSILIFLARIINKINYFNIYLPRFNLSSYILYYVLILLIIFGTKIWVRLWNKRKMIKILIWTIEVICIVVLILQVVYINYFESYVIYFNVGQGNMALVHDKTKNVIVDMGSTESGVAYNIMKSFLIAKNIYNIDLVLITHMHTDHMNGVESLIEDEKINVRRVGFSVPCQEVEEYKQLLSVLRNNKVGKMYLKQGDNIKLGNIFIEILSPPNNAYIIDDDMLNANSTVYLVTKNTSKYLFMGDCTKKSEKYILDNYLEKIKKIEAYQVSHHGSSTSSYEPLISSIVNCNAIISSKKSVYGHPADSVVSLLEKYKFNIYITEKCGAILL